MPKKKNEDKMLIFRCHAATILKVKAIAAAEGRTVSAQIRHMIEDYPLKPRFIKAAKNTLKKKPDARPQEIIQEALAAKYPTEVATPDTPPVKPSPPAQWWNAPTDESPESASG